MKKTNNGFLVGFLPKKYECKNRLSHTSFYAGRFFREFKPSILVSLFHAATSYKFI